MTIIDFIQNLPSQIYEYEIDTIWERGYHCPVCGKFHKMIDEEKSCEISEFYKLEVEDCIILFDFPKIIITYTEQGYSGVCKICEDKKQAINLFGSSMTEQKKMELSNALARYSQWFEKYFNEDNPDKEFHSDLKNLYLIIEMARLGI